MVVTNRILTEDEVCSFTGELVHMVEKQIYERSGEDFNSDTYALNMTLVANQIVARFVEEVPTSDFLLALGKALQGNKEVQDELASRGKEDEFDETEDE